MSKTEDFSTVSFDTWTGGRDVRAIGTNSGTDEIAFQSWRRFKEAFAPEIVERALRETSGKVSKIVDPFGGSGTTALAAQFLGVRPVTIEVNPFLADLIESKLYRYDLDKLGKAFSTLVRDAKGDSSRALNKPSGGPPTLVQPGVGGRYIFSKAVFTQISRYRRAIEKQSNEAFKRFFRVHLGAALIPCSNVLISGKGRRYRSNWETSPVLGRTVGDLFKKSVASAIADLGMFENRKCRKYTLLRGDARKLISSVGSADIAVFSPPYPNSFDYTDVYNVELWALGYLTDSDTNKALRTATLRSHVQIKRDLSTRHVSSRTLLTTVKKLEEARLDLWNVNIPAMIAAYADDMHLVMQRLFTKLRTNGRVYMVVGDSRYSGIDVPVARILIEEAESIGYRVRASEESRSMRASPQQGGQKVLAESLLVLEKC